MPHILVLEDDLQVRRALLRALGERGYATSAAGKGMAGLEAALHERPGRSPTRRHGRWPRSPAQN